MGKGIASPEDASKINGEVPPKLLADQPVDSEGVIHEKNSMECGFERAGKELMIMDLRDLMVQSLKTNIWGV